MTKDRIAGLGLLVFCLFFYFQSTFIDVKELTTISAAFFPRLLLGLIATFAVVMLIQSFTKKGKKAKGPQEKNQKEGITWLIFALFAVYIYILPFVGFIIASFLFIAMVYLILLPKQGSVKSHVLSLLSLLGITIALSIVFEKLLNVFLPKGIFF